MLRTLTLHNDINDVELLPEWLESLAADAQMPVEAVMPLNLALEEATVNVMNYAFPAGETHEFVLKAEWKKDDTESKTIAFIMEDSGVPFDPTAQEEPDVTLSAEERPIGGLGIFLVKTLMKEVTYRREDNKNILTMVYAYGN